jgi:ABC-2 type transport system permease protein
VNRIPATRLVARREIAERLRGRAIWVITAITTVVVVALIMIPAAVRQAAGPTSVGLAGPSAQALRPALARAAAAARISARFTDLAGGPAARAAVRDGSIAVALSVGASGAVAQVKQAVPADIRALVQAVLDQARLHRVLAQARVPPATVRRALAPVPLATVALQPVPRTRPVREVAALAAAVLLYVSLGIYGAAVAVGVAQEKTTRTAEVLLAALRPAQLLGGKVTGIGLCGLGQLGITVVAGLLTNAAVNGAQVPSTVWILLPAILVWFLLGYALYSFAFAAAGALVARQEEVQFVTAPFAMLLVGSFALVYAVIGSHDAWWAALLSFVPPLAPVLMPARIALGPVPAWQIVLNVLVLAASIYGMARLAGRIYSRALVRGGARVPWRVAAGFRADSAV